MHLCVYVHFWTLVHDSDKEEWSRGDRECLCSLPIGLKHQRFSNNGRMSVSDKEVSILCLLYIFQVLVAFSQL